jgi:hypothetical protein
MCVRAGIPPHLHTVCVRAEPHAIEDLVTVRLLEAPIRHLV